MSFRVKKALLLRGAWLLAATLLAATLVSTSGREAAPWNDPWGVCFYQHPNYTGERLTYTIGPGMRQVSVPVMPDGWDDQVSSIKVGGNVALAFFIHRYWGNDIGWLVRSWSADRTFTSSQPTLGGEDVNDKLSSFVLYPKTARSPLGVWGFDLSLPTGMYRAAPFKIHLFPAADVEGDVAEYRNIGFADLSKDMNGVASYHPGVSLVLYEGTDFQGASLTLPGPDSNWDLLTANSNLGQFGWSDRAASMKVYWKGPSPTHPATSTFNVGPGDFPGNDYKRLDAPGGPIQCEAACGADQKCKAFTWVEAGSACYLKNDIPASVDRDGCISGNRVSVVQVPPQPPPNITFYPKPEISGKANAGRTLNRFPSSAPSTISLEPGYDRPGGDYRAFDTVGGHEQCQAACANDARCKAFTWVKAGVAAPAGKCWLKDTVTVATKHPDAVSGLVIK
jgi:hypothetical protein